MKKLSRISHFPDVVFRSGPGQEATAVQSISRVGVLSAMDSESGGVFSVEGSQRESQC